MPQKTLFRPDEVANICAVTKATVYRWIEEDTLKALRLPGGHLRITYQDLHTFLTNNQSHSC